MHTTLTTAWVGNIKGEGVITSDRLTTAIAVPKHLGGTGEGTDPKSLLLASAASCYLMTLVAILQNRKVQVTELAMQSEASEGNGGGFVFDHRPVVRLSSDATGEQVAAAEAALSAADKACVVGNMLKKADVHIRVHGSVTVLEGWDQ